MNCKCHKYSEAQSEYIRDNITGRTLKELTQLFNERFETDLTCSQLRSYVSNRKLKSGLKVKTIQPHQYTPDQVKFIRENISGITISELTKMFNMHFGLGLKYSQIKSYASNNGLKCGINAFFPKGHIPFNKGKKGLVLGGVETQFKKGEMPHNYMPVGSERVRTPRTNRISIGDYIDVKIADPNQWQAKHIFIWKQHNGPVPKGHTVIFGDGDNRNFDLNNLILVSRRQLAILNKNRLIQNDADLTRTAVILADISLKIGERKNKIGSV